MKSGHTKRLRHGMDSVMRRGKSIAKDTATALKKELTETGAVAIKAMADRISKRISQLTEKGQGKTRR